MFVLHGNVDDLVRVEEYAGPARRRGLHLVIHGSGAVMAESAERAEVGGREQELAARCEHPHQFVHRHVAQAVVLQLEPEYRDLNWEMAIFQSDAVNAFAMPGGKIGVMTGLAAAAALSRLMGSILFEVKPVDPVPIGGNDRIDGGPGADMVTGGGGTVSLGVLANEKPDGYILSAGTSSGIFRIPVQRKVPYKPLADFTHIFAYAAVSSGVVVKADAPWKTWED